jgi:hypothetical protein
VSRVMIGVLSSVSTVSHGKTFPPPSTHRFPDR